MPSGPDLVEKEQLLSEAVAEWDKPDLDDGEVYIRILYWFEFADEYGSAHYWGHWVYAWNRNTRLVDLFEDWLRHNRPYGDLDDFRYQMLEPDMKIDIERTPADYGIDSHATILVEDDNHSDEEDQ
ncbi:hypothetical protein CI109_102990 [Kwoniella shandongensis]|uniref:Uncharacterized protein n=1 Tax=Kwoniella shandongensis TaxID=1734106 RepID=A0A5M6C869_9TREE|nr:uncharacterized protein CI109_000177 [Kwoniella shandongensis]KAA5531336.1 hypothetical protein CI109_000177 [Kwoniella shandongensis]